MYKLEHSGIDVIETDDLPEADQHLNEDKIEDADKKEDPFRNQKEYEFDPTTSTLEQKVQSLWLELTQLQQQANTPQESKGEGADVLSGWELLKEVEALKVLLSFQNPLSKVNLTDAQGNIHKKLLSSIDKFAQNTEAIPPTATPTTTTPATTTPNNNTNNTNKITYRLNYPVCDNLANNEKLKELEKRITKLDGAIGSLNQLPSPLLYDAYNKSILDIVASLASKSKVLEAQNWSEVEVKAGGVIKRMDQIQEKRDLLEQKAKMDKVSELYSIMLRWNKLTKVLPLIAHKLQCLKTLHNQALEFNQGLSHLEVTQQRMSVQLKGQAQLTKTVQSEVAKNLMVIKARCEAIQHRINKIN